jgi:hypothetical protein
MIEREDVYLWTVKCDGGCGRQFKSIGPGPKAPKGWRRITFIKKPKRRIICKKCQERLV